MSLYIQDPDDSDSVYFVEALLEASQGAQCGGGAFAFATAAGAKLLLEDEAFRRFSLAHAFQLIVGVDAVTNTDALKAITAAASSPSRIKVQVFLHEHKDALFHPKLCWFRTSHGGQLIVGSSNLTIGGLRANWESFSVTPLSKTDIEKVEADWTRWLELHSAELFSADDPRIIARASRNTGLVQLLKSAEYVGEGEASGGSVGPVSERATGSIRDTNTVLIAEIPRSGDRWNQANFDVHSYEQFFGAKVGTQRRILLQHVQDDGTLGDIENRPSVAVRSQNYRFELLAAAGRPYPPKQRPIGVFVRVANRTFRYRLLMPGDPQYSPVRVYLGKKWSGPIHRMRRVCVPVSELREAWPAAALWRSS
jgi:hypothetical protein